MILILFSLDTLTFTTGTLKLVDNAHEDLNKNPFYNILIHIQPEYGSVC